MKHLKRRITFIKFLIVGCMLLIASMSCKKDTDDNDQSDPNYYKLMVYPDYIEVGNSGKGILSLTVSPPAIIDWKVDELPSWLIFDKESGTINGSTPVKINFEIPEETGIVENYTYENINFISENAKNYEITFILHEGYNPFSLEFSTNSLTFPLESNTAGFSVLANESPSIYYYFENVPENFTIEPESGYFASEQTTQFNVTVNKLVYSSSGSYKDTLLMKTSLGTTHYIKTTTEVYIDGSMWKLPLDIIDAEYDYETDQIYAVISNPNSLVIIDAESETYTSIPLVKLPTCLSINTATKYAAIGHDAFFSYVNLATNEVENVYPISIEVFDILLSSNGFAYATSSSVPNVYGTIKSINLETGEEIQSTGPYNNGVTILDLHPSEDFIYARQNSSGADDIHKYSIQNDTAVFLYKSNLSNSAKFGIGLWVDKPGERIFTGETILTSSDNPDNDMLYAGIVSDDKMMMAFDDAPAINRFCGLLAETTSYYEPNIYTLAIYSLDYINPLVELDLPPFFTQKSGSSKDSYIAEGRFVFIDSGNSFAWVIVEAEEDYPDSDNWAIVKFNIQNY